VGLAFRQCLRRAAREVQDRVRAGVHFNLDGEPTSERRLKFSVLSKHLSVVF